MSDEKRDNILALIRDKPRHYSRLIKSNSELHNWVVTNSLVTVDHYPTMIYSAVHQKSNVCEFGKEKTISRFSEGWVGCGPATVCECTRKAIADNVSKTKLLYSDTRKKAINQTRTDTMVERFGVPYNSQRLEVKEKLSYSRIPEEVKEKLTDYSWLYGQYITQAKSLSHIAQDLGIYYGTVGEYCKKFGFEIRQRVNYSLGETQVCEFLNSMNVNYIASDWNVLGGKEIDILIPSYNFGIEINGLRWHSFNPFCTQTRETEDKNRHLNKTTAAKDKGISLIHITDFEWANQQEIVKSLICTKLGLSTKLYARKLTLKTVSKEEEKQFLNKNHFQGYVPSKYSIGLYNDTELYSLITVGKSRYSKSADIEILRICTKMGYTIVGGTDRLFAKVRQDYNDASIVSYCDLSKFTGGVYERLGFICNNRAKPSPHWTDGNYLINRHKCTRENAKKWVSEFDDNLSVTENMFRAKYRRYWDCGQSSWIYTPNN